MMMTLSKVQEDFDHFKKDMFDSYPLEEIWSKLELYTLSLSRWSRRLNLVSKRDLSIIATKHIRQALLMAPIVASLPRRVVLDLGSGSGLPAIPIKIALPDSYFILVESRRKRAHFLKEVIRSLELNRIEVINDRIENWEGRKGGVDLVTARAVAAPDKLLDLVQTHLSPHGWILSPLGQVSAHLLVQTWRIEEGGMGTTLGLYH
jgi:16S rRNA (guanine527-N7)-methyltransferase